MVIEINGASHEWKDGGPRAKYLQSLGMRVLNFTELEVRKDLGNVLDGIASVIREMVDGERGGAENPPPR